MPSSPSQQAAPYCLRRGWGLNCPDGLLRRLSLLGTEVSPHAANPTQWGRNYCPHPCRGHREGSVLPWASHLQEAEPSERFCKGATLPLPSVCVGLVHSACPGRRPCGLSTTQHGTRRRVLPLWLWGGGEPFACRATLGTSWPSPGAVGPQRCGDGSRWDHGSLAAMPVVTSGPSPGWGNPPIKCAMTASPWEAVGG